MTENQQIFDKLFKPQGGQISLPGAPDFQPLKLYMQRHYPTLPEVHIDYAASSIVNAYAAKYEKKFFIGINAGTYLAIVDMFTKILSSSTTLTFIGDSAKEGAEKKLLNLMQCPSGIGVEFLIPPMHDAGQIKDPLRSQLASFYATFSLDFVVLHEFAHIIRGHVGCLNSQTGFESFPEIESSPVSISKMGPSFFQTIEMDADSMALNRAILIAEEHIAIAKRTGNVIFPVYRDWETFIFHWTFAIYCLFRLFGFGNFELEKAKLFKHPPPSIRIGMMLTNIATIFIQRYSMEDVKKVSEITVHASKLAEQAFQSVSFASDQYELFLDNWKDKDLTRYILEIAKNWNNVRSLLEPFAFGDLPPLSTIELT